MNEQIELIPQDNQVTGLTIEEFLSRAVYTPLAFTDNEEDNKLLEAEARAEGEALDKATIEKYHLAAEDLVLSYGKLYAKLGGKITNTAGTILKGVAPVEAVSLEELRERQAYYDNPASDPRLASFMSAEQKQAETILKSSKVKKPRAGKEKLRATKVQAEYNKKAREIREIRERIQPTSEENVLEIIRQIMNAVTKEYYLDITNDLKELKPEIDNEDFEYCYQFLTYRVAEELQLLEAVNGNSKKAKDIIWRKADSFFPIPKLDSVRPTEIVKPVDKLSNEIASLDQDGEMFNLRMATLGKKNIDVVVPVSIDSTKAYMKIAGNNKITSTDLEIENAIISLLVSAEQRYFTTEIINNILSGDYEARLTPAKREEIENSINKMRYIPITIDSREMADKLGLKAVVYDNNYYLPVTKINFVALNGGMTSVWKLLDIPPRYQFAESLGHIERLPLSINNTPLEKSIENINLQNYLLRRVLQIKRSDKLNNTILFESIYSELGALEPKEGENANSFKQRKKSIRDRAIKVLEFYKTGQKRPDPKSKYKDTEPIIRSYQINAKGKEKYYSISIEPIRKETEIDNI